MERRFTKVSKIIIVVLTLFLSVQFAYMGLLSQIKIDMNEIIYLFHNNVVIILAGVGICIAIVWILLKYGDKIPLNEDIVFYVTLVITIGWVLVSQNAPSADADHCFKVASELADGITHSFDAGQYLDVWRQQNFLVLYMYLLTKVGGKYNYILFQVINAFSFSYMCKAGFAFFTSRNKKIANVSFFALLFYAPIWMSVTYVYGNLLGMVFGILAILYQFRYFENGKRKYALVSAIFIGISIAFKMFFLIFLIAMIAMFIWNTIETKCIQSLIWVVICAICYIGVGKCADVTMNMISNNAAIESGGMPMTASIVMGLDIYEEQTNPGWYNGYNVKTYYESEYNKTLTAQKNKNDLHEVVARIKNNPFDYLGILVKKNHTVWNESTFDVLFRSRLISYSQLENHSYWYNDIMSDSGKLHQVVILLLQCMQVVVYIGVAIYCVGCALDRKYYELIGLIIFIGGVMFLTFWEAKSEYVMGYFLPLVIYSITGYEYIFGLRMKMVDCSKNSKWPIVKSVLTRKWYVVGSIVIACVFTAALMPYNTDETAWDEYVYNHTYITTGDYKLCTAEEDCIEFLDNTYIEFDIINGSVWAYRIYDNSYRYYFIFQNWDEINTSNFERYYWDEDKTIYLSNAQENDTSGAGSLDCWKIFKKHGGYVISSIGNGNKVWTYNPDSQSVTIENYSEGNNNQIWFFNKG